MMRKPTPRRVTASSGARGVLEEYDVSHAELLEAWCAEAEEEMLVLTRGERCVVLVYEEGGILQLATPADVRSASGAGGQEQPTPTWLGLPSRSSGPIARGG